MRLTGPGRGNASMLWLEPHRVHAGGQFLPFPGAPGIEALGRVLAELPAGPTHWVVDDAWVPSLLLRDIVELPKGAEAREAFFKWRYGQELAAEGPQHVQALALEGSAWLLAGMPQELREAWIGVASAAGRPMRRMQPRWLWLYNLLAPSREVPGMLMSLSRQDDGMYTGTLAAWGRSLTLLRQWPDPAGAEVWVQERVLPTVAYLQRDGRTPQEAHIWGAPHWPDCGLPLRVIPGEIPAQEAS